MANWIKGAIKSPGSLSRSAKRAGMSPMAFARSHQHDSGTTGRRARLALTLRRISGKARLLLLLGMLGAVCLGAAGGGISFSSKSAPRADATTKRIDYFVVRAGPCNVYSVFGYNAGAAQFIQFFDATNAPPTNGTAAVHTFAIGAADNFSCIVPITGMPFGRGFTLAVSTTAGTLTLGGKDVTVFGTMESK